MIKYWFWLFFVYILLIFLLKANSYLKFWRFRPTCGSAPFHSSVLKGISFYRIFSFLLFSSILWFVSSILDSFFPVNFPKLRTIFYRTLPGNCFCLLMHFHKKNMHIFFWQKTALHWIVFSGSTFCSLTWQFKLLSIRHSWLFLKTSL